MARSTTLLLPRSLIECLSGGKRSGQFLHLRLGRGTAEVKGSPLSTTTQREVWDCLKVLKGSVGVMVECFFFVFYNWSAGGSLLVELADEGVEEADGPVKFIPDRSGGFVAVFWPLKLFRHTGQVSCWTKESRENAMRLSLIGRNRYRVHREKYQGGIWPLPAQARVLCNHCGTYDCMEAVWHFLQHCNLLYTPDILEIMLEKKRQVR